MNQSATEYLLKEISEILGVIKTTPMQDLLMVDCVNKANDMFKKQIISAYWEGVSNWDNENSDADKYFKETYK